MAKQMSIKEKEEQRKNKSTVASGMINADVKKIAQEQGVQEQEESIEDNLQPDAEHEVDNKPGTEQETIEALKKQLEEAKAALKVEKKKKRTKDKKVNILMYPDLYEALQKKCKKQKISVTECLNQLAEIWVNQD